MQDGDDAIERTLSPKSFISADTVSESQHASARMENRTDRLAAPWKETSFSGEIKRFARINTAWKSQA